MTVIISSTNELLNLPEEVLRIIFAYLDDEALYHNLRHVCCQLKMQVENFVELGKFRRILDVSNLTIQYNYTSFIWNRSGEKLS